MEEAESISVAPSAENGNISVETEPTVPATEPTVETPVVEVSEPTKHKMPDGRELTSDELYKEYTENLLPEFTRKSQRLAEIEKSTLPEQPTVSPYANPEYVPTSYEEILQAAEERALQKIDAREADRKAQSQALETQVATQLEEVRKLDPTVNADQLFLHATKYGFQDLKVAHQNMSDMAKLAKTVKQQTAQDIQKRQDPVSISPGATGTRLNPDDYASPIDYLRAVKGQN